MAKTQWKRGHLHESSKHTQMSSLFMNTFMCCKKYKNVLRDVATLGVQLQGGGKKGGV